MHTWILPIIYCLLYKMWCDNCRFVFFMNLWYYPTTLCSIFITEKGLCIVWLVLGLPSPEKNDQTKNETMGHTGTHFLENTVCFQAMYSGVPHGLILHSASGSMSWTGLEWFHFLCVCIFIDICIYI